MTPDQIKHLAIASGLDFETMQAELVSLAVSIEVALAATSAEPFQGRVQPWMLACFGAEIASDHVERNHRFFEEATETVQANGMTRSEAHQLVDYTFDRPVGELNQEVGGVMVTLAALCLASGVDMHAAGETELTRIWTKVEQIRAKQAAKPKHSPLPAAPLTREAANIEQHPVYALFTSHDRRNFGHLEPQAFVNAVVEAVRSQREAATRTSGTEALEHVPERHNLFRCDMSQVSMLTAAPGSRTDDSPADTPQPVDYDRVVSICDAHGICLPVDCVEMVVEIVQLAAPHPRASDAAPCRHADDPKSCYRVRCQLGNKCVDDDISPRNVIVQPVADDTGAWQPIETAPKTGRTLLLGYPNAAGKWRATRGQWMSEAYIAESWEEPDDAEPGWYETSVEADDVPNCWPINPTHWMRLPASPVTAGVVKTGDAT